ncbi:MAG: RluA family pseudouridine synthase [Proteobacteria bacterium]|nr:RluA family pseudouridine synthase [Pseudomonadota bacterium]
MVMIWESTEITVLASGKGWLALDKPTGITVHNASGKDLCSLAKEWVRKDDVIRSRLGLITDFDFSPIHRLDKETSGVIILAADRETSRFFSDQFKSRKIAKQYIAILHGRLDISNQNNLWESWAWPLSKTAGGRQNPQGPGQRIPSETRFRIMEHSHHYTMVEIDLLTGRKHQIRRHAKLSGHPVVGDTRYGSTRAANYLKQHAGFIRLGLHAQAITIHMPGEKNPQTIKTPCIPAEMQNIFETDRKAAVI